MLPSILRSSALVLVAATARAVPVDVELSLLVDTSSSISDDEYRLQVESYADLVGDPAIVPQDGTVAINMVFFTTEATEVVPWTIVADAASAAALSDAIRALDRQSGLTGLGDGLITAALTFDDNGIEGARRVIDVSGDGRVNTGTEIDAARREALQHVDVINGLPITTEVPTLDEYYATEVIGGAGAFLIEVVDFASFRDALRQKLLREIGSCSRPPDGLVAHWPFDEASGVVACDAQGSSSGLVSGCVGRVPGMVAGAFDFSTDGRVAVETAEGNAWSGDATILSWLRVDSADEEADVVTIAHGGAGLAISAGRLAWRDGSSLVLAAPDPLPIGTWSLVGFIVDGSALSLVQDGVIVASAGVPSLPEADGLAFGDGLGGALDEVLLFDRALAAAEVMAIRSAGSAGTCRAHGCSEMGNVVEGCLWPPNHRYACFTDLGELAPGLGGLSSQLRVIACTSNQPDDASDVSPGGDGATANDCVVAPDGSMFCVRSERAGSDPAGRAYEVLLGVGGACGGGLVTVHLSVPHDQHDRRCASGAPRFLLPHDRLPWGAEQQRRVRPRSR